MTIYVPLERQIHRGVLGIRFIDAATGAYVTSGLHVTAWQLGTRFPLFSAVRAQSSGVYGYRSLPGLEAYVRGERPLSDFCADADAPPSYALAIEDGERRFLPQLRRLCLPKADLFTIPLYSDPARMLMPGIGVIRGQVVRNMAGDPLPAPWAVVRAQFNGGPVYETICDERGAFVLFASYPRPSVPPNQWNVTLRVRSNIPAIAPVPDVPLEAFAALPDFAAIIGQAENRIFNTLGDAAPVDSITRTLLAGVDLIAESNNGGKRLFIQPLP